MRKKHWLHDNALSVVALSLFLLFWVGQSVTGWMEHNQDEQEHGQSPISYGEYLTTGHFFEATAENWESEFLQMGMLVLLTIRLRQRGSPESKSIGEPDPVDRKPGTADMRKAPWAARQGGLVTELYSHSLSIALMALFVLSFLVHAWSGAAEFSNEQIAHGGEAVGLLGYLATSRFWFESFQNWQSEFLAVAALTLLSIWLRENGSPESKPIDAPHDETGTGSGPTPRSRPDDLKGWPKAA